LGTSSFHVIIVMLVVPNRIATPNTIIEMSPAFCHLVLANSFRSKAAGKIKAIGAHVIDPRSDKNLSRVSARYMPIKAVSATSRVRMRFLDQATFIESPLLVVGLNMASSMIETEGLIVSGYPMIKVAQYSTIIILTGHKL